MRPATLIIMGGTYKARGRLLESMDMSFPVWSPDGAMLLMMGWPAEALGWGVFLAEVLP